MCVIYDVCLMAYDVRKKIRIRRFNDEFVGRKIISFLYLKIINWYSNFHFQV